MKKNPLWYAYIIIVGGSIYLFKKIFPKCNIQDSYLTKPKEYKIPFWTFIFFILCYSNQGLSGLPDQCLYYLVRESWGLSATMIGLIGIITGLAWYTKVIWGYLNDYVPIKGYLSKYYLYFAYILIIVSMLYIVIFGLNFTSLIITGLFINIGIALADVANDKQMCLLEREYSLNGKIQAIQWGAMSVCCLVVSLLGAYLAFKLPETINYRVAYGICLLIPISALIYLKTRYFEQPITEIKVFKWGVFKHLKNKDFLFGLLFIVLLRFSPGFGTALMIKCREELMVDKMFLGYVGALGTVVGMVGYGLYYWKACKFNIKKMLYFTIIFGAITNLFYLFIPNKWFLIYYSVLFGAFDGISFLAVMSFMVKILPTGSEALFYAFVTSVNNLAGRLGSALGGIIYDNLGYNANVLIASGCTLLCILVIPFLTIKEDKDAEVIS